MSATQTTPERPEPTDALWDTTAEGMTRRYADRLIVALRQGDPAAGFARMAASFAFLARPELREARN